MLKQNNNGSSSLLVIAIIAVVLLLAGYFIVTYFKIPVPFLDKAIGGVSQNSMLWKKYTDEKVGFSFKYPNNVTLGELDREAEGMTLSVSAQKIADIPENLPSLMGRNDVLLEKAMLEKGDIDSSVKIGALSGIVRDNLSQFEVCSVILTRSITFYPSDYKVVITLQGPIASIMESMPEFFTLDPKNCGQNKMWDLDNKLNFIPTLEAGKGNGIAQQWYDTFNEIVKTIEINEVTQKDSNNLITSTPTSVPNNLATYKNDTYKFELNYPKEYDLLTTKDDLYGYPNGILLLYNGGQTYDVVVEVWNTKAEIENAYSFMMQNVTIYEVNGKFISLLINSDNAETQAIKNSFKINN